jgi:hypothetical protein
MTEIVRRLVVRYQLRYLDLPIWLGHQCFGDGKMKKPLSILACTLVIGFATMSSHAWAQAKTAKACTEEWRADKAGFQAKGITEKAYVASCRAGTAATPAAAPSPTATAPSPVAPSPAATNAGQKTAKACTEEWRADKAGFQAKGITEKVYVAACRAGTVATPATAPTPAPPTAAPTPAPTTAAPAPAPSASRPSAQTPYGTTERGRSTGSPSGAGQFANEAQAKATCPGDTVVWVNLRSKIYHFAGTHNYGNTKDGAYMCERDTAAQGMRPAKNEQHP